MFCDFHQGNDPPALFGRRGACLGIPPSSLTPTSDSTYQNRVLSASQRLRLSRPSRATNQQQKARIRDGETHHGSPCVLVFWHQVGTNRPDSRFTNFRQSNLRQPKPLRYSLRFPGSVRFSRIRLCRSRMISEMLPNPPFRG
jgi:hypothetical protein